VRPTLALVLLLAVAAQLAAVFRTSVHWDEFGLLHQVDLTRETGVFESGGRPGLATLVLLPFVASCDDEVAVIRRARLLWVLVTLAFLAGLFAWTAELSGGPEGVGPARRDGALAVALLALVPAFLETSVQVRTDQLALAGGAWGGAALLASRRHEALAAAAGAALALGFLGSQKLLYLGALAGLLAAGQLWVLGEWRPRREAMRALLLLAGAGLVLLAFPLVTEQGFEVPREAPARVGLTRHALAESLSRFEFYRHTIGWSQYARILPTLVPHALLALGLLAATLRGLRGIDTSMRRIVLAWAVLGLGTAVALFHAGAFRYFWMTLGVFPAVGLALARRDVLGLLPAAPIRLRGLAVASLAALLAVPALFAMASRLRDAQAVQRESLAFIHRNFDRAAEGFHPERGLFCQAGSQPRFTWFSQHIYLRYGTDPKTRARNSERLIASFREAPVRFILESFRLHQFPPEVQRFWDENYQPYRGSVFVAGRRLAGQRGQSADFELLVPGAYRWLPAGRPAAVSVDGRRLEPGQVLAFEPGPHRATFDEDVPAGMLVLALADPPGRAPLRFYQ
jgi:hypothetical protein